MPARKNDAAETPSTEEEPAAEPVEAAPESTSVETPDPAAADPEERARAALTGERVTLLHAELDALLAGEAFTPDEQGELRHLVRQNRILVADR